MKKVKLNSKLSLKKETIAKLNDKQMGVVKGGGPSRYCTINICVATNGGPDCHA